MSEKNHAVGTPGIIELLTQEYDAFYHDKHVGFANDPTEEDFLQRILSYLLTLPDLLTVVTTITTTANEWDATILEQAWNILMPSRTKHDNDALPNIHSISAITASNNADVGTSWEKGLILAARVANGLSPTELHGVASSLIFLADTTAAAAAPSSSSSSTSMFVTTCLLLCCRALLQCPSAPIEVRWNRWQSLLLETVRLYQLFVLVPWRTSIRRSNPPTRQSRELLLSVRLWSHYISPALAHLQQALVPSPLVSLGSVSSRRWIAFEAGTTGCVARLAIGILLLRRQNDDDDDDNNNNGTKYQSRLLQELLESWDRDIRHGCYEWIYEHPWRQLGPCRSSENLTYYTTNHQFNSDEQLEDRREQALGTDTVWSPLGIAVLVATQGWEKRPCVWTVPYAWRMLFPHVSVLLQDYHSELNADVEEDNDDEDSNPVHGGTHSSTSFALLGFQLLQNLLQNTPTCSLSSPGRSTSVPDCPIGTCQLIANQIIVGSAQEKNLNSHQRTTSSLENQLPSAGQSFQLLKSLVGKYDPLYQIQLIQELYQHCPHPGLRPKILDILRPFVTWDNSAAQQLVCQFLDEEFLRKLENHVVPEMDADGVQDLVDHVEVYTAAMGLVQLWLLYRRNVVAVSFPGGSLSTRLVSLQNLLERVTSGHAVHGHTELFRLHLLENSLRQTVERLSVHNESGS